MRVFTVESVTGYADAVASALRSADALGDGVPVLRPPTSALPAPERQVDRPVAAPSSWDGVADAAGVLRWRDAHRPPAAGSGGPVLGFGDVDWALPALLHAHASGRPFAWFDDPAALVEAARRATGPVTVCAPPDLLTRAVQDELLAALSFTLPRDAVAAIRFPGRALSYLTARTLPVLSGVVAAHHRRAGDRDSVALGLFPDPMTGVGDDDLLVCVEGDALTSAAVRAAPPADLVMTWGHSREDLFGFGKDALCGLSFEHADARPGAMTPMCVHSGRCVKPGDVLPVNRLGAGALVLGGCNVLRLGGTGLFAPEFSLAFSAQEGGTSAVVTASGVVIGSPVEFLFLYRLLRGGLPLGEAVRLLNAALPFLGPDSPSYDVLGEGDRVLFTPPPRSARAVTTESADGTRVEFRDVTAEYVEVPVPRFDPDLHVRFAGDSPDRPELHFAIVPHADGTATAYVFGVRRLEGASFTVTVSARRPGGEAAEAVHAAMRNLTAYGKLLRGYRSKIKGKEQEWRSTETYLARHGGTARHDVTACVATDLRAEVTDDEVHDMDRLLCEHYIERTASARAFTFHEQCLFEDGTFAVVRHSTAGPCQYCGDQVMVRTLRSSLVPEARRSVGICRTCGTIWDRPEHLPVVELLTDPVLRPAAPQPVGVRLRNPSARRVRGWVGVTVRRARQFGYVVEPGPQEVVLAPGDRRTVGFTLSTTDSVPTDAEFLRAYWSSELGLTVAQRTIWTAQAGPVLRPAGDRLHLSERDS